MIYKVPILNIWLSSSQRTVELSLNINFKNGQFPTSQYTLNLLPSLSIKIAYSFMVTGTEAEISKVIIPSLS